MNHPPRIGTNLQFALFVLGLVSASYAITSRAPPRSEFAVGASTGLAPTAADAPRPDSFRAELRAGTPSAHSATLARLGNGDILAYWFAGTREGAGDVRIYGARLHDDRWTQPEAVMSVQQAMADEWRFIRKLGNPVAVVDSADRLHLFFVSVSVGGWATSNLNQMVSEDGGQTWGRAHVLVTSPFLNISTLARTAAVQRADGGFDLPIYHELANKIPEVLRFDARGHAVQKLRMGTSGRLLQPAMVALDAKRAIALLRDASPARILRRARTDDGGKTWNPAATTDLVNPDASVALARFPDGTLLLAYNPLREGRSELALATSTDGVNWVQRKMVESEPGGEFSYPSLLVSGDDTVHLVYTWQRKLIRHIRFNRSWLDDGRK